MVGGRLRDSVCLLSCSALLLLGVFLCDVEASSCPHVINKKVGGTVELSSCLPTKGVTVAQWKYGSLTFAVKDVEASSCPPVIDKKVGDTVELSSCLPTEGVTAAQWKYGSLIIAEKDFTSSGEQFKDRLDFNPTNYSLTVRRLTLKDSGDFSFVSEANDQQRKTVTITLQVHEPITKPPILIYNSIWHASNESCTVSLKCDATSDSHVTYEWTVRNQTINGSTLQYIIRKQDKDTRFTCTIRNVVSEMSASKTVKCSEPQEPVSSSIIPLIIWPTGGILLFILLLSSLLWYIKSKDLCHNRLTQSQTVTQDDTQQQVYSSLLYGDASVYDTVRGSEDAGTGDDCVYEPMGDSAEAGKEKSIISKKEKRR